VLDLDHHRRVLWGGLGVGLMGAHRRQRSHWPALMVKVAHHVPRPGLVSASADLRKPASIQRKIGYSRGGIIAASNA
jgi:hypothetical protein